MSLLDDDDLQVGTKVVVRPFWRRLVFSIMALAVAGFIGGYVVFAGSLAKSTPQIAMQPKADGIVVLTGGTERLQTAFALLQNGKGARLLISGVGAGVTKNDLQSTLIGNDESPNALEKITCCLDLDHAARDTVGNAGATAAWAKSQQYQSLIVVTSAYHMPRAMIELGRAMPNTKLAPFPVRSDAVKLDEWWTSPDTAALIFGEYLRAGVAFVRAEATRLGGR
ncbi:MAG: YdcF family protein [Alphaproteobacteria bacterium]